MAPKIFLAHAREDKAQVRKLYADLTARGFDPWLDEVDLVPGQIWKEEIPRAIRQAGVFLACLSSRSAGKVGYVQNEFRLALSAFGERPPGSIYLIPVRLDECDVPDLQIPDRGLSLQDIQWVDLWQEGGFDRLVKAIEHALGVAPRPQEGAPTGSPEQAERRAEQETREQAKPVETKLPARGEPKPPMVFRDINDEPWCPELAVISPGTFMMGDEDGQHEVRIAHRFAVGRYPVTFEEYDRFAAETGRGQPKDQKWGRGRRPVINVSWNDAKDYVAWLSQQTNQPYRLLSEAEWEYACRAGTTTRYSWGNDPPTPEQANFMGDIGKTTEVGSYPPNPWGLYDMHGNVWEWVEDCWNDSYKGAPSDGSAWTSAAGELHRGPVAGTRDR
jgi:formylglycine-generating enzyme required for sulfatase activity